MKARTQRAFFRVARSTVMTAAALLAATVTFAQANSSTQSAPTDQSNSANQSADSKPTSSGMTRLRIRVIDANEKPVGNASVYVRYYTAGGFLHHEKLEELNFKTNQDGSVKVPEIPQGKILIQVIAKGWHTYGKWYDVEQSEESVPIKLDPPPHWY
jgi:hypothetical protein